MNNFIKQVINNDLQDKVIITVSDNFSTDATYDELIVLQEKYPNILDVSQHHENIGARSYLIYF